MNNINEMFNKSNLYDKKAITNIFNYIINRINGNLVLSEYEQKCTDKFIDNIKKCIDLELNTKNKLLNKIGELYLMSVNNKSYKKINEKPLKEYNKDDILYYLNTFIESVPQIITKEFISSLLERYFYTNSDTSEFLNIIDNHKNNISEFDYEIYYNYIVKSSYTIFCNKIISELNNENINTKNILKYLDILSKINVEGTSKRFILLQNIIKKLNIKNKLNKFDSVSWNLILEKLDILKEKIYFNYKKEKEIKNLFESGNIILNRIQPYFENINSSLEKLDIISNEKIFVLNRVIYNKELAFSIRKDKDIYNLKVYLIDIPIFLHKNKEIAKYAYNNGENMFVKYGNKNLLIPMLPLFLVRNNLAFNEYYYRNTIEFDFIINNKGEILSRNISRKNARITDALLVNDVLDLLKTNENSLTKYCMFNYYNLCQILYNSNENNLNINKLDDADLLIKTPLKLIDDYIYDESEFAIYNDRYNHYTKDNTEKVFSSLPLSKYVCDINLAFFLEQKGIYKFDDKDLYFVKDNIDEIINHLNQRHEIKKYAYKYPEFVKKYVR